MLNIFAHELGKSNTDFLTPKHIFDAIENVRKRCVGAYAVVAIIPNFGLVAFRDQTAFDPYVMDFVIAKMELS